MKEHLCFGSLRTATRPDWDSNPAQSGQPFSPFSVVKSLWLRVSDKESMVREGEATKKAGLIMSVDTLKIPALRMSAESERAVVREARMNENYLYVDSKLEARHPGFAGVLKQCAEERKMQMYLLCRPLGESKYTYDYEDGAILLAPNHKAMILNLGEDKDGFENYQEDLIEDMASISDKFNYKDVIGRVRHWRETLVHFGAMPNVDGEAIDRLLEETLLDEPEQKRGSELLVSLLIGSINDIDRVKAEPPRNLLDRIKQKIVLFDSDQTRFIYTEPGKKVTVIQGMSGTGKTELLLHKLKDLYLKNGDTRILFTCHNRILASSLRDRIPEFFNFMKVEEQIKWRERLWCVHAWGSGANHHSGAYRYICSRYDLPFESHSRSKTFEAVCKQTIDLIKTGRLVEERGAAFDYALVDESQDLPESFMELCDLVTHKKVYVAGDVFQSIFDSNPIEEVKPDYLLNKCYRTDPKTLMFAHGISMGLFEQNKLQWLSDEGWERCGYNMESTDGGRKCILSREPVRRFEDLSTDEAGGVKIKTASYDPAQISKMVIEIIKTIKDNHPTVEPDDIGVIFLDESVGYSLADILEVKVHELFNWQVNKAYETKGKMEETLFVSSKNNVKGLEFPFVICVAQDISDYRWLRNALYMALTRSFIRSWLIVNPQGQEDKLNRISRGLDCINKHDRMEVDVPTLQEQEAIRMNIDAEIRARSLLEIQEAIFDELDVSQDLRIVIKNIIDALPKKDDMNYSKVREIVEFHAERKYG